MAKSNLHFELGNLSKVSPAVVQEQRKEDFPEVGDFVHLYVETLTNLLYRWNGNAYVPLGDSSKVFLNNGTTAYEVGGIPVGTNLYGKTYDQILNLMLYSSSVPTLTDPSITITLDKYLFSLGSSAEVNGVVSFERGKIDPAYGTSGYRAGLPEKYYLNGATINSSELSMPFSVVLDNVQKENNLTFWVQYRQGEQPKDSNGNDYELPLLAGRVSAVVNVVGASPVFSKLEGSEWTEQGIEVAATEDGRGIEVDMPAEPTSSAKQVIAIDAALNIIGVKQYDEFRNVWDWIYDTPEESLEAFNIEESTVTDTEGNEYAVRIYTNALPQIGSRKLRFYTVMPEEE